jgi:hypothetical protein
VCTIHRAGCVAVHVAAIASKGDPINHGMSPNSDALSKVMPLPDFHAFRRASGS